MLVEQVEGGHGVGLTDNYIRVEFPSASDSLVGKTVQILGKAASAKGIFGGLV